MTYTYLALGDSYTIGEQVPLHENFPFQTAALLKKEGLQVADPVIIATTGWTTDELAAAIRERNLQETFSFVTLLIGVNNQYRGRDLENYKEEYTQLLDQAIRFANGHTQNVFVLSTPDWGVTPFAEGKDRQKVAQEIDAYNKAEQEITEAHKCHYIYITDSTRKNGTTAAYLAEDGLHPSGNEYRVWAERLAPEIAKVLKH
ncbi:MAG: lysophospholipase [Bacteroidetes bacterium 43-93]|nr:SGNH/GDSL hydrolase family protein [Bacteroidota bacterium]OJX01390.1 MAG: lysophospholipase [Bacteroidetes bacterium 43-93]